jgi:hypothetical protein
MKNMVVHIFDKTLGKILRLSQRALLSNDVLTVQSAVLELSIRDTASYVYQNLTQAMRFQTRQEIWAYSLAQPILRTNERATPPPLVLEFGVWKGESANFFAQNLPNSNVFGFDSFEGLEEDWYGHDLPKGTFDLGGVLPKVEDNVTLIKGWFENTLPNFKQQIGEGRIGLLHMDADTYKPTSFVLNFLSSNISSGTIVIFDEYFGYPNWRQHEFKAWQEFVLSHNVKYRYIAYSEMQCAIEVI